MKSETYKKCVLYDKICTDCGDCERCDLDPDKICDSCGKCLDMDGEFREYKLDSVNFDMTETDEHECDCECEHSHGHGHHHSHDDCDCGCEHDECENCGEYELDLGNLNDEDLSYLGDLLDEFDVSDYEGLEGIGFGSEILDDFEDFDDYDYEDFDEYENYEDE